MFRKSTARIMCPRLRPSEPWEPGRPWDVGRVLGISYGETDAVAKLIPHRPDMTIGEALKGKQLAELYRERLSVRQLLDTVAVEGMPRTSPPMRPVW